MSPIRIRRRSTVIKRFVWAAVTIVVLAFGVAPSASAEVTSRNSGFSGPQIMARSVAGGPVTPLDHIEPGQIVFLLSAEPPNRCLDADLNTIGANGTRVQLWDCNNQLQQQWFVGQWGNYNYFVNQASGRCLDADTNTAYWDGGVVQLWDCNNLPQQKWGVWVHDSAQRAVGFWNQWYEVNASYNNSLHYLDADLNTIGANGTKVQTWTSNLQTQQIWFFNRY